MARDYGKRDPSSHRTPEQMHAMDRGYNHTPEHIRERSERNQARRMMAKKMGWTALKGKDIDHKRMVKDGGTNAPSNLRVVSASRNRGWADGKV